VTKRWLLALSIIAAVVVGLWFALPEAPQTVKEGDVAPTFSLADLDGKQHALPTGEVILLNLWATWCPPCREEMPSMISLHNKLADKGLKVIAVSVDSRRRDLERFVREYQLPFLVLHDADTSVSRQYGVFRFPESFLIDRQGKVRYHLIGAVDWMSAPMLQTVEGMLNEPVKGEGAG